MSGGGYVLEPDPGYAESEAPISPYSSMDEAPDDSHTTHKYIDPLNVIQYYNFENPGSIFLGKMESRTNGCSASI